MEILPFKSRTSTFKSAEVSPGVQIGFLAGFADLPIVKSFAKMTDALGVNDMPGLGKQTMDPPPPDNAYHMMCDATTKDIFTAMSIASMHFVKFVSDESISHIQRQE